MGAAVLGVLFGGYELLERFFLAPRLGDGPFGHARSTAGAILTEP